MLSLQKNGLDLLLYFADTLAFLPYNTVEEPLFVVHHIDMTISITGTNLLQQFKEVAIRINLIKPFKIFGGGGGGGGVGSLIHFLQYYYAC